MLDLENLPDKSSTPSGVARQNVGISLDALPQGNADTLRGMYRQDTTSPDEFARTRQLSRSTGLPVPTVRNNLPKAQQLAAEPDWANLETLAPKTAQALTSSTDLFNLSKDDTENLSWWERGLRMGKRAADYIVSSPDAKGGLVYDMGAGVLRANTGAANVFRAAAELPAPLIDPLVGRILPENPLRRVAEGFREMGANSEATAKRLSPNDPTIVGGGVSSGVQSLTQNLLMLPMALLPGGQSAALAGMVGVTGGEAYGKAREEGLNAYNAAIYGTSQGVIEYATERGPLGQLVKDVKAGSGLFKTLINNVAREVPGEQVATLLQDLNEWAALNPEKTFGDYLADRPAAAAQTLIATVVGVGGNVAVMRGLQSVVDNVNGTVREGARVQDAMVDFAKLTEMFERAAQSKTRERAPDSFAQFVQELADSDEGAISEVFIDPQTLVEVLNQAGVEQGAFLAQMPSVVEQLGQTSAASTPIALPIGELMAYVPGTGLESALLPHLRTAPDALSQAEAQQVMGESQAFMQSAAKQAMEQADDVAALEAGAEFVRGKILEQLNSTKRFTGDINEAYANLVRDFYTATSSRLRTADGKTVTPEQMWNGGWKNAAGVVQPARQLRIRAEGMPDTPVLQKNNGLRSIVSDTTATEVEGALGSYVKGGTTDPLSPQQRSQAEALLAPLVERASAAKPAFDALVSRINARFGLAPKLAPVKGLKRAAEKLVVDGGGDINTIRDMLRATIVVPRVEDVQAAIDQVRANFEVVRVKDRFATPTISGYRDVLINVRMPDGTVAEIQINVPAMLEAKDSGHKLYEMARVLPEGDPQRAQLEELQSRLYAEAFEAATSASNSARPTGTPYENTLAESGNGRAPLASTATSEPSGSRATATPSTSNSAASGGSSNISGTSGQSVADAEASNQQVLQARIDAALDERPAPVQATLEDFTRLRLPELLSRQGWAVLTAEDPGATPTSPEQNAIAMTNLEADLREMGVDYLPVIGKYGEVQNGFIVVGLTEEEALALGRKYGQESVLTRSGLIYQDGAIDPATGVLEVYESAPEDFYTEIPGTGAYFSVEIDFDARRAGVLEQSMSTRQPWGKPKKNGPPIEDAMAQQLTVGMEAVRRNPTLLEKFAAKIGSIISLRTSTAPTAEQQLEDYIEQLTSNLLWLHDTTPAEIRQRAKLWYDGARAITERFVQRYGNRYSDMQVAGVLAVMSPQMDWFQNVTLGERILDIYDGKQDFRWTEEMTAAINQTAATDYPEDLAAIAGKTLGEIDNTFQQALWVVAYDRAYNPTDFRVVTPEGDFTEFVKTGKGENMKGSWANGFGPVEKSIAILRDGSAANVSAQLGEKHKVRNFYNNIFAPTAPDGSVTIDTHAVAAATLLPLAGSSPIVADNFGAAGSDAATGVQGSYPVYAEAYRRAAAQRGVLAREMQSITWEAVRGLFTPAFKARYKRNPAEFDNIWNEYHAGNLTLDAARQRLFDFAGGITNPDWAGRDRQGADQRWSSSYAGDVLAQGGLDGAARSRARGNAPAESAALGRVNVAGIHFSRAQRARLDGLYYGSGLKGLEAERLATSSDSRLKQRVYFYVDEGNGVRPEAGVGGYAHQAQLTNLYDAKADPLRLWRGEINDIEARILDAGFSGYYIRDAFNGQGAAVVLGQASRSIPAEQIANPTTDYTPPAPPAQRQFELTPEQAAALDAQALREAAPSAVFERSFVAIRPSRLTVNENELELARTALAGQGVELPADALTQPARGTFSPSQLRIDLLKDADLSTFLHETGHFFLEMLADIATQPGAPQDVVDDMGAIMKWFGVADAKTWMGMTLDQKRPYHEKFAESFEQYLFEGKAPSAELKPLFRRFREFLTSVYKSLQDFMRRYNTELTDEVRGVFDRLIATQEQIAQAEREAGMLPDFEATNEAIERLSARSLRDLKWVVNARSKLLKQLQADVEDKRKAMREEVTAEVRAMREYAVQRFLKFGELRNEETGQVEKVEGGKLSMPILKEMYGEGPAAPWRYLATNMVTADAAAGLHPNMVAELFGFRNGDEMVRAVIGAMPEASAIDGLTDQRLLERYGDLATPAGIERAANEAIHNEARARFVASEIKAMREAMNVREKTAAGGSVNVIVRAAKEFAQNLVARRKVRELKPGLHTAAESRAAKRAEQLQGKGDTQGAIAAKRDQLLNHYAAKYTIEAQAEVDKKLDYLRKFDKESVRKKLPPEYLAQIDALLERFDLRRGTSLRQIDKRATLLAWVQSQQELGLDPAIPEELLDEAMRKSYKEMTVEEFRGVVDTVRNIEHLGRLKDKLLTLKDQREFAAVVAELEASIRDNATKERPVRINAPTKLDEAKDAVRAFFSMHRKVSSLVRQMDGLKDGGVFWRVLVESMNTAGDREAVGRNKATQQLAKIFEPLLKSSKMRQMALVPAINQSLSLETRLAIALNWGNEANRQRVMDGDRWSQQQVEAILGTLTADQLKFVQKVWDYIDSYWPDIKAKEERVSGVAPEKVQASPFTVRLADGTEVQMGGGYYPIKYDPDRSSKAEADTAAEITKQMLQGQYTRATTRRGHTKARAETVNRAVRKDLGVVFEHVNQVIHDLSWHEWLIDATRILRAGPVDAAIRETMGPEVLRELKEALKDIAAGEVPAQNQFERAINHLRNGTTIVGMGWNLMTALMQPLGLTQSIVRVGPKWVGKGLATWFGDAAKLENTVKRVYEQSEFMRMRGETLNRELNEIRNKVKGEMAGPVKETYFYLIQKLQLVVDMPTWLGAYEKAIAEGFDEERSVALADQAVRDAQGAGQIADLARIQRGGPLQKLFTNFYNYFNTTFNLTAERFNATNFKNPLQAGRFMVDMLMLYTVPAVLGALMKDALKGGDDGEDELVEKLIREQLNYLLGTMVGLRELGAAVNGFYGYQGPAGTRFFSEVAKLGKQVEQGEIDEALLKALNNAGGILLHYPAGQVNRTVEGYLAYTEGRTDNPLALVFGPPPGN